MKATFTIAQNTFREARREKLILLVALIALMLVGGANYFLKLDLGHERLRFVFDFTSGALGFFGAIIAVILTCRMFHTELENRTIITLLSKPVRRADFIFGKFFGVGAMLFVFCAAISAVGAAMLYYTQIRLSARILENTVLPNYLGFFSCCFLQWTKLCTVSAISILICSMSRSMMFSTIISFMVFAASLMASATVAMGAETSMVRFATTIFPDLQMFSAAEEFIFAPTDFLIFSIIFGYALVYSITSCALASWIFSRREF